MDHISCKTAYSEPSTFIPLIQKDQLHVFFGDRYLNLMTTSTTLPSTAAPARSAADGNSSRRRASTLLTEVPGNSNQLYFFRGLKYVGVDNSTDEIINIPSPILDGWLSLAEAGFDGVDVIVESPGGGDLYYVFREDKYARIKVDSSRKNTLNLSARLFLGKFSLCIYPVFLRSLLHGLKVLDNPDQATEIQQRYAQTKISHFIIPSICSTRSFCIRFELAAETLTVEVDRNDTSRV